MATVLAELVEATDFAFASEGAFAVCNDTAIQRLGYIVENIIGDERQGEIIHHEWVRCCPNPHYHLLSAQSTGPVVRRDERWRIDVNTSIEIDEL